MPVTGPKDRQTGYYRFKTTGKFWKPLETAGVWVSLLNESSTRASHQNNEARVCSCSSRLALRSVMTSRVCRADIPRIREAQKNDNKQQYGSAEIRCTQRTLLRPLHDQRNMPFWNQCQLLSLNEPCCHAAEHTGPVVWQPAIVNERGW